MAEVVVEPIESGAPPENFSLDKNFIGISLDGNDVQLVSTLQVQLRGLGVGYHLLRAFLIYADHTCVKTPAALVEAEFYVNRSLVQLERPFMFGQPSIIVILGGRIVDFFVHNCVISPRTYFVRITLDGEVVGEVDAWVPYELRNVRAGEHRLLVTLVNTFGEEITMPKFNYIEHTIFID